MQSAVPDEDYTASEALSSPPVPEAYAVSCGVRGASVLTPDGELLALDIARAAALLEGQSVLICHAGLTRHRLGLRNFQAFDLLELFAFVRPGAFCVPSPAGLARALSLSSIPPQRDDQPFTLIEAAQALLSLLREAPDRAEILAIASAMKGWSWTPFVFAALAETWDPAQPCAKERLRIWERFPEWSEKFPPTPEDEESVTEEESLEKLSALLRASTFRTETRERQAEYASVVTGAFVVPAESGLPHTVLAEAGTGTGKTLGYLAPASLWAEKNSAPVWISTFTKTLQRQLESEMERVYPDPDIRDMKAAVRKGRENYLCLLNLEEYVAAMELARLPADAIAAGLMLRWAGATKDGDLSGRSFPGWIPGLLGAHRTLGLADRRGECLHSACRHYHRCFPEKAVRKARRADLVIANHALVMSHLVRATDDLPGRFVFDEGHLIFDAADSAFGLDLTGAETFELRRWILGMEGGRATRSRGLGRRIEDLVASDSKSAECLQDLQRAARRLTSEGWRKRLTEDSPEGPVEKFLCTVFRQVLDRADGGGMPYSLETLPTPLSDDTRTALEELLPVLANIREPLVRLANRLRKRLAEPDSDTDLRRRLENAALSLESRGEILDGWCGLLEQIRTDTRPEQMVDWAGIEKIDGKILDTGLYRRFVDPAAPFGNALKTCANGVAITSATLRGGSGNAEKDWSIARSRTGANEIHSTPALWEAPSPFDYAQQSRILIFSGINRNNPADVARACEALIRAADGGVLMLFTAIRRLRAVHAQLCGLAGETLEQAGIPIYAQHADGLDTGTLVDMFRDEEKACLMGTDAVRDGMDVPGDSLKMVIYDRVPWPRPDILHKARREAFGGREYDELIARLRLRQAFGRLIRRADDRGIFVMLESALPSRLLGAFPEETPVHRLDLSEAENDIRAFFSA